MDDRAGLALSSVGPGPTCGDCGCAAKFSPLDPGPGHADRHRRGRHTRAIPAQLDISNSFAAYWSPGGLSAYQAGGAFYRCTTSGHTRPRPSKWSGGGWIGKSTRPWPRLGPSRARPRPMIPQETCVLVACESSRRSPLRLRGTQQCDRQLPGIGAKRPRRKEFRHARHVEIFTVASLPARRSTARGASLAQSPSGHPTAMPSREGVQIQSRKSSAASMCWPKKLGGVFDG